MMTEVFVMSDGDHSNTTSDQQTLIAESGGWAKVKRNRFKILAVGFTMVALVSCIVALAVTRSGSISTDQSLSTVNDHPNVKHEHLQKSRHLVNKRKQLGKNLGKRNSNEGRQFAIAFPSIFLIGDTGNSYECIIIAREAVTVTFFSPYIFLNKVIILAEGEIHTESFNSNIQTEGDIEGKAIYITADGDIIVQCAGTDRPDTDSFLALPYTEDDKEYILAICDDYPQSSIYYIGFVNVVATANNTQVNIMCPPVVSECPEQNYTVALKRYETYSLYVRQYSDLTGFYISSTKPVSVYTGSPRLPLYDGTEYRAFQFLTFTVPPLHQLGTSHYTPETIGDPNRLHRLRIVAAENTNLVIPHNGVNEILERFEFFTHDYSYFNESVGPLEVSCSKPCLVIHCNKEHNPYTRHAFMMRVIPTEAYSENIVFSSAEYFGDSYYHYLSIVVSQYPVTDLYLDGSSLASEEWFPALSGNQAGVMIGVLSGLHQLSSTNNVKFAAYSQGDRDSYSDGYGSPAGVGAIDSEGTPDDREPPAYSTILFGNFTSFPEGDFDFDCTNRYSNELRDRALAMIPVVNDKIRSELCSEHSPGDFTMMSVSTNLTTSGPGGETDLNFKTVVDRNLRIDDVYDCMDEVSYFLRDHVNWGLPLLPQLPGCPLALFDPPVFYSEGDEWFCVSTSQESTPAVPGYELDIASNFTTFSEEDLSSQCASDYSNDLTEKVAVMQFTLNNEQLGSHLYSGVSIEVITSTSSLVYQGSKGIVSVQFIMQSADHQRFTDIFSCADEVMEYVFDHANWGLPLLPQIPGCPFLVFHEQRFYEEGQRWLCISG